MRTRATIPAVCGMTAAPLMVVVWAIASVLRPGYNQLTQKGSELGTGQNSIVMNLDFALTGVLIMAFALGLARNIIGSKLSKIGATLLLIAGMCEVVVAGFPCDPGCPAAIGSFSQNVHLGIALVFFSSIAFAPLFVGIGLGGDQFWKPYGPYTTASGIASVVLGTAFSVGSSLFVSIGRIVGACFSIVSFSLDRVNGDSHAETAFPNARF